jgi:hypothetical protein
LNECEFCGKAIVPPDRADHQGADGVWDLLGEDAKRIVDAVNEVTCVTRVPLVQSSAMQPYQHRVVEELEQLFGRINKLQDFFGSKAFLEVEQEEQGRLRRQYDAMSTYAIILRERIAHFQDKHILWRTVELVSIFLLGFICGGTVSFLIYLAPSIWHLLTK